MPKRRSPASILDAPGITDGLAPFIGDRRFGEGIGRLSRALAALEGRDIGPAEAVERLLDYYTPIAKRRYDDHPKRLEDLDHLAVIARKYRSIESFLTDMALEPPSDSISDILREDPDPERLILSTIHSAKGLEWHSVFIIWAAEGYFPTTYAAESADDLEEELRLMYVAATRAKENPYDHLPHKDHHPPRAGVRPPLPVHRGDRRGYPGDLGGGGGVAARVKFEPPRPSYGELTNRPRTRRSA